MPSKKPNFAEIYTNNPLMISPYDKRDYKFKNVIPLASMVLPDTYETEALPYVFDQGKSSMCCACSYSYLRALQERDQSEIDVPFSPMFTYANRLAGETMEGMYVRSCLKKGKDGSVPWDDLPGYGSFSQCKAQFSSKRSELLRKAKPFAITSYYQCSGRETIKSAIMLNKAVIGGVYVYDSFYCPNSKGEVKFNKNKDTVCRGGHAIVFVGWKTDSNGDTWWRVQNSWGPKYGDKDGRIWLHESYPWTEDPWCVVDDNINITWNEYKEKYGLKKGSRLRLFKR